MMLGFLVATHAKQQGAWGIGRRPPGQAVLERTWELMDKRLAEYEKMDAEAVI